jgi:ferredoxin
MDFILFKDDELVYLPKDQAIQVEVNQEVNLPINTALPSQVVHHFIDKAEVHWIMDFCICRVSTRCQDFPQDVGCLFMGEAARDIDPRLGRLVSKEEAHEHIKKAGKAGLVHLIGRNKLDTVWLDVGPGKNLLTVCNCCNCCCLWKMLPNLAPDIGSKITKMDGIDLEVTSKCKGCGTCQQTCFVNAIKIVDGKAHIGEECRGCGRCVEVCPEKAIKITLPEDIDIDRTIRRIEEVVNV